MIVALVGLPASGKGEAAKVFEEGGFSIFRMRSVIENELDRLGLPHTEENMGKTGTRLRREEGDGAVAKRLLPKILAEEGNICIEGVRDIHELHVFEHSLEGFVTIGIRAMPEERYEWSLKRGRKDDIKDFGRFLEKDRRETAWGMETVMAHVDYVINNYSDLETFRQKVGEVMEKILNRENIP